MAEKMKLPVPSDAAKFIAQDSKGTKLTTSNGVRWMSDVILKLNVSRLSVVVFTPERVPMDDFIELNMQAVYLINNHLSQEYRDSVRRETSAHELWKALSKVILTSMATVRSKAERDLQTLRWDENKENAEQFCLRVQRLSTELQDAGSRMPVEQIKISVHAALPQRFLFQAQRLSDAREDSKVDLTEFLAIVREVDSNLMFLMNESKRQQGSAVPSKPGPKATDDKKTSALAANQSAYCRICKTHGHTAAKCPDKKKNGSKDGKKPDLSEVTCWKCNEKGHFRTNCPNAKKAEQANVATQSMKTKGSAEWALVGQEVEDDWRTRPLFADGELERLRVSDEQFMAKLAEEHLRGLGLIPSTLEEQQEDGVDIALAATSGSRVKYSSGVYDPSDFMLQQEEFEELEAITGKFDGSMAADKHGYNSHTKVFWSREDSFLESDPAGLHLYGNPPWRMKKRFLEHIIKAHKRVPDTSAVMILPYEPNADWWKEYMEGWVEIKRWPAGSNLFTLPSRTNEAERRELYPCHVPVVAMWLQPGYRNQACVANSPLQYLIDSGATSHMVPSREYLHDFQPFKKGEARPVRTASKDTIQPKGKGSMRLNVVLSSGETRTVTFRDVLYVPGVLCNLISLSRMEQTPGVDVSIKNGLLEVCGDGEVILDASFENNMYLMKAFPVRPDQPAANAAAVASAEPTKPVDKKTLKACELAHCRLGHLSLHTMLKQVDMVDGLGVDKAAIRAAIDEAEVCPACMAGRMTRGSRQESSTPKAEKPLHRLHADLVGPIRVESMTGKKYWLTIIDEATRYSKVVPLKSKDAAGEALLATINAWERQTGSKVVYMRVDGGKEFVSKALEKELKSQGIEYERTARYSPESNGLAERTNRTLIERMRCLLAHSGLPDMFWEEAVMVANELRNRAPSADLPITPFEAFKGRRPSVEDLRVFGCVCYAFIPKEVRDGKLAPRAVEAIHIWTDPVSKISRVFYDGRVREVRDVRCDETRTGWQQWLGGKHVSEEDKRMHYRLADVLEAVEEEDDDLNFIQDSDSDDDNGNQGVPQGGEARSQGVYDHLDNFSSTHEESRDTPEDEPSVVQEPDVEPADDEYHSRDVDLDLGDGGDGAGGNGDGGAAERRYPRRSVRPVEFYSPAKQDRVEREARSSQAAAVAVMKIAEPETYAQAMASEHATQWRKACEEELEALARMGTFNIEPLPAGERALPCKWVFKVKYHQDGSIERFKARLVVGGHRQRDGIDYEEVFAPVGRFETLRVLFAIAAHYDLELHSVDISNAFLNGVLDQPVYMAQPEGFQVGGPKYCCKLKKTLYGLKQSPREWFKVLADGLESVGFTQSENDRALWIRPKINRAARVLLLHWVDDLIIASEDLATLQAVKKSILGRFKGRDLGEVTSYLNVAVVRDRKNKTLTISQPAHLKAALEKFNMEQAKPRTIPMAVNADYTAAKEHEPKFDTSKYAGAVGALMYVANVTRPDLSCATSILSRHFKDPTQRHWQLVKALLCYVVGTVNLGLTYKSGSNPLLARSGPASGPLESGPLLARSGPPMVLEGWTDSDYAACKDTRRSRGGYLFTINGTAVAWSSRMQTVVATSTAEAEYIAGAGAAREAVWLRRVCSEMEGRPIPPVLVRVDNQAALNMAVNNSDSARTKHIDVHYHFLRQVVARNQVKVSYVRTDANPADMFTKPLATVKFEAFRTQAGLC